MTGLEPLGLLAVAQLLLKGVGVLADFATLATWAKQRKEDAKSLLRLARECLDDAIDELSRPDGPSVEGVRGIDIDEGRLADLALAIDHRTDEHHPANDAPSASGDLADAIRITWRGEPGDRSAIVEAILRRAAELLRHRLPYYDTAFREHALGRGERIENLVRELRQAAAPTLDDDALSLLDATRHTRRHTATHRRIQGLTLHRTVDDDLLRAALAGSLLALGEPGSGKTGALHELVRALIDRGERVVFLSADHRRPRDLGDLRAGLRLGHELHDVMAGMTADPDSRAFLVIDALDKAPETAMSTYLCLIDDAIQSLDRWHVVAAMRTFDASHRRDVQALFPGEPVQGTLDPCLSRRRVRHLCLGPLDLEPSSCERRRIADELPLVDRFLSRTRQRDLTVLRNPFNLWLLSEILRAESPDESSGLSLSTTLALLEAYWDRRVLGDAERGPGRAAIEFGLRNLLLAALDAGRLLFDDRDLQAAFSQALQGVECVKSSSLLIPAGAAADIYQFSHDLLLDYAASRLLLRGRAENAVSGLCARSSVVLMRPALELHCQHLLSSGSPEGFWEHATAIAQDPGVPGLTKSILGIQLARHVASMVSTVALDPGLKSLNDRACREGVLTVLESMQTAVFTDPQIADRPRTGADAPPWCALFRDVAAAVVDCPRGAELVRRFLVNVEAEEPGATPDQRAALNLTARSVVRYIAASEEYLHGLASAAIDTAARTADTDPGGTEEDLLGLLDAKRSPEARASDAMWLATNIERLMPLATLAPRLYEQALEDGGATQVGLTGDWHLRESYPGFLAAYPSAAVRALEAAIARGVEHDRQMNLDLEAPDFAVDRGGFVAFGHEARCIDDGSCVWDSGGQGGIDLREAMLDALEDRLIELADEDDPQARRTLLAAVAEQCPWAAGWRRVLRAGSERPSVLGVELPELLTADPIIRSMDAFHDAARLVAATHPFLQEDDRRQLERRIGKLRGQAAGGLKENALCQRYLRALHRAHIVDDDVRTLRDELLGESPADPGCPLFGPIEAYCVHQTQEERLTEARGREPTEADMRLAPLWQGLQAFCECHSRTAPSMVECLDVMPLLRDLHGMLGDAAITPSKPDSDFAWHVLTEACTQIARTAVLLKDEARDLGDLVQRVLLNASRHAEPAMDGEVGPQWDDRPGWSVPAPRVQAAEGLTILGRLPDRVSVVRDAVIRLSADESPEVQFQVARWIYLWAQSDPDTLWDLLDKLAGARRGVARAVACESLTRSCMLSPERAEDLALRLHSANCDGGKDPKIAEGCAATLAGLWVRLGRDTSRAMVDRIVQAPTTYLAEADCFSHLLIEYMAFEDQALAKRAGDAALALLRSALGDVRGDPAASAGPGAGSPATGTTQIAETMVATLHLQMRDAVARAPGLVGPATLLERASELVALAAEHGSHQCVHDLLEMLLDLLPDDPVLATQTCAKVMRLSAPECGRGWLAPSLATQLVDRLLCEHPETLRNPHALAAGDSILEHALQAGDSRAQHVAQRLQEAAR